MIHYARTVLIPNPLVKTQTKLKSLYSLNSEERLTHLLRNWYTEINSIYKTHTLLKVKNNISLSDLYIFSPLKFLLKCP